MYNSITALALLNDEQIAVIAAAVDSMAKTLPPYAPKPLNMKKPIDKEIQVVIVPMNILSVVDDV